MSLTPNVLIANAEIATKEKMGIGYYPIGESRKLNGARQDDGARLRAEYFHHIGKKDEGQKLCLYLGGNNSDFYENAFPAFCEMVPNKSQLHFVVQPHPSSKELKLPEHVRLSDWNTMQMLTIADLVLYHQTSMAPLIAFAGIPLIQVADKIYLDMLTRSGVAFASSSSELLQEIEECKKRLYQPSLVGFRQDWPTRLRKSLLD
ncbi:MAG: hypothetical protein S4CHLAM81_00860 [Chlamydiales bacterium]|nr:hypothetical protein [Chlamydiales bacterium]MCH9634882.1 hypothetical protein [Chlamydiales bacterium]MCH9703705.1 hypothetical protein [Chlamydiota bacterium]